MAAVGTGPVALDTSAFIYFIEEHPRYRRIVEPVFAAADKGRVELVTSAITLLEVLVIPFRAGNGPLAQRYEALLSRSRGLRLVEIDRGQLRATAQIRAAFKTRTPDAFQLSAALTHRCTAFVTNDRAMPAVPGLKVLQLSAFA